MTHHGHGIWVGFVVLAAVGNFALNAENNDSRIMYIPKKQFLGVIAGIIDQSGESASLNTEDIQEEGKCAGSKTLSLVLHYEHV